VLVIGIHEPALESCRWEYEDLHRFVRQHHGYMALAHPFRYQEISVDLKKYPPDAIEVFSPNTPLWAETRIRQIAAGIGCDLLSNSDSHNGQMVGKYYNVIAGAPGNDGDLLLSLKKRNMRNCYERS
jgi:hypothetical protein